MPSLDDYTTALAIVLIIIAVGTLLLPWRCGRIREHYGAANERHAGLNRAMTLNEAPGYGWPSFYLSGYRGDSASSLSHMQLRD